MDYLFLLYMFTSGIFMTGGAFYLFTTGRPILGGLFFIGTLLAAVLFGFRWFLPSGDLNKPSSGAWPPIVNSCPDFLSLYVVDNKAVCIDTLGIGKPGGLTKWTDPTQTSDQYIFNLFTNLTGNDRAKKLCEECEKKKVTWEGVYDGSTCLNINPPLPPPASSLAATRGPAPSPSPSPSSR